MFLFSEGLGIIKIAWGESTGGHISQEEHLKRQDQGSPKFDNPQECRCTYVCDGVLDRNEYEMEMIDTGMEQLLDNKPYFFKPDKKSKKGPEVCKHNSLLVVS